MELVILVDLILDHTSFNGVGSRELTVDFDLSFTQEVQIQIIRGNDNNGGEEVDNLFGEELRLEFEGTSYGSVVLGVLRSFWIRFFNYNNTWCSRRCQKSKSNYKNLQNLRQVIVMITGV